MAPKRRASEPDVFQLEEEQKPEERLNLLDGVAMKRALDDAVIQTVCDAGHIVDNSYTDTKIVLGLLACAVACLAQFWPKKYPANTWVLAGCVAAYVVLSTLMTLVATVWEKEAIVFTKARPGGSPVLVVSSKLPRFQDLYTLRVALRPTGSGSGSEGVSLTKSVGEYFHEDGHLAADVIRQDTLALLEQLLEAKSK
ncbi:putative signal peptidase complex subunit 2 [Chlorella sorokiniana]|uniref:Signal peptidase complex subunit 2 n=1 Tax=Chlorella sorokiniana TaxID=3076 RepID=A0A2P6TZG0_CHLSO|nr:putative signal peptidase complex subunit 2 [Chlorella sorokiniana]|eukprot:PRW59420.1 putative signal peptidase complex subunit 2 [Chlorella sorokiniana]